MWVDDVMAEILANAADEFAACGNGQRPCYVASIPGASATDVLCDDGGCGQVTIRLVQAFLTDVFPAQAQESKCNMPMAFLLELRAMRCYEDTDEQGEGIDEAGATAGSVQANADMLGMLRAIQCNAGGRRTSVLSYEPEGPQGNYVGGTWTFYVTEDI